MKHLLRAVGAGLALLGVAVVAWQLRGGWDDVGPVLADRSTLTATLVLAALYALASILLAVAWWNLLRHCRVECGLAWTVRTYGVSQLAKYLPGNVFHLAGRQALGMAAGVPAGPLIKSAIWELASIALAGATFGSLLLPLVVPLSSQASVVTGWAVVALTLLLLRYRLGAASAFAFACHVAFLGMTGSMFVTLCLYLPTTAGPANADWTIVGGAYVVAWLIGLVTPGAPAGAGIREVVLLYLLDGVVADAAMLSAVVLSRIITMAGDSLFFAAACLVPASSASEHPR